jgi:hypothetical protein
VRLEIAVGIGDEGRGEAAGGIRLHRERPRREPALRIRDRDRDGRVLAEAAAVQRHVVVGVVVAVVDRELGRIGVPLDEDPFRLLAQRAAVVARVDAVVEAVVRVDVPVASRRAD